MNYPFKTACDVTKGDFSEKCEFWVLHLLMSNTRVSDNYGNCLLSCREHEKVLASLVWWISVLKRWQLLWSWTPTQNFPLNNPLRFYSHKRTHIDGCDQCQKWTVLLGRDIFSIYSYGTLLTELNQLSDKFHVLELLKVFSDVNCIVYDAYIHYVWQ